MAFNRAGFTAAARAMGYTDEEINKVAALREAQSQQAEQMAFKPSGNYQQDIVRYGRDPDTARQVKEYYNPPKTPTAATSDITKYLGGASQPKSGGIYIPDTRKKIDPSQFIEDDQPATVKAPTKSIDMRVDGGLPKSDATEGDSILSKIGNAAMGFGKALFSAPTRYGKGAGSAVKAQLDLQMAQSMADTDAENIRKNNELAAKLLREGKKDQANRLLAESKKIAARTPDIKKESEDYAKTIEKSKEDLAKGTVGTGAFFVPGGGGIASRIAAGGLSGGMAGYGSSQKGQELPDIIGGGIVGAGTTGALELAGAGLKALRGGTQKAGQAIKEMGTSAIQSQYDVPRSVAKNVDLKNTVSKLADYGVTDIKDVGKVADLVTGGEGIATKVTRGAVANAKPVSLLDIDEVVKNIASDPNIPVGQDGKLTQFIDKGLQKLTGKMKTQPANPSDLFEFIQTLENKAREFGQRNIQLTSSDKAMKDAYLTMASELKDRLFQQGGADGQVVNVLQNPEVQQSIQELAKKYPKIAQDLINAKTIGEVRSVAAPFVRGNIASEVTQQGTNAFGKSLGEQMSGKGIGKYIPSLSDPLAPVRAVLSSDKASQLVGSGARTVGEAMSGIGGPVLPSIDVGSGPRNMLISKGVELLGKQPDQKQQQYDQQTQSSENIPSSQNVQSQGDHLPIIDTEASKSQDKLNMYRDAYEKALRDPTSSKDQLERIKTLYNQEIAYQKMNKTGGQAKSQSEKIRLLAQFGTRGLNKVKQELGLMDQKGNPLMGDAISDNAKVDQSKIFKNVAPGKLWSRTFDSALFRTVQGILRMQTGAVAPEKEIRAYMEALGPQPGDSNADIIYKIKSLEQDYLDAYDMEQDRKSQTGYQPLPAISVGE